MMSHFLRCSSHPCNGAGNQNVHCFQYAETSYVHTRYSIVMSVSHASNMSKRHTSILDRYLKAQSRNTDNKTAYITEVAAHFVQYVSKQGGDVGVRHQVGCQHSYCILVIFIILLWRRSVWSISISHIDHSYFEVYQKYIISITWLLFLNISFFLKFLCGTIAINTVHVVGRIMNKLAFLLGRWVFFLQKCRQLF